MATITWLHLSDLHLKQARKWDKDVVLKGLLDDVRGHVQSGLRPDLILISGDVASSAAPAEYDLASVFFDDLLEATGLGKERLFIVPGNHDVDWQSISPGAEAIAAALSSREAVGEVLDAPEDRRLIMRRLDAYAAFVRDYFSTSRPLDDTFCSFTQTLDLAGRQVAVLGLNSAWLAHGGEEDRARLLLSERQVLPALAAAKNADLRLALLHHHFEWLREFDRGDCELPLLQGCAFTLHGHLHRSGILSLASPDAGAMVLAAGAAYAGRDFPNCYNVVRLDLAAGRGTIFLRRYSDVGSFWAKDTLTYHSVPDGQYTFPLPAALVPGMAPAPSPTPPGGPAVRGDLESPIPQATKRPREKRKGTTAPIEQEQITAAEIISDLGRVVYRVKELVESSEYSEAVALGEKFLEAPMESGRLPNPEHQLTLGELGVWCGHALIYTGKTEEAIKLLRQVIARLEGQEPFETLSFGAWRRNLVLGRAHNHIGYANWMALGQYEVALQEFRTAIRHFAAEAEKCREELATAYDNMGRVYAQIGHRTRAELLVESGRQIRLEMHDDYRYALSLNSRALVHLAFGQPDRALALSKEALAIFNRQASVHGKRGTGLALLTMGQAQRYLGSCWQYSSRGVRRQYRAYFNAAIKTLEEAISVFEGIDEPLRRFQACNELGCVYRERAVLGEENDPQSARQAEYYLKRDLDIVRDDYPILYVDACEDLAQTYFRGGDYGKAEEWIGYAEEMLANYRFRKGASGSVPKDSIVDSWQQLGKICMLRGHMKLDALMQRTKFPRRDSPAEFRQAIEYYTLAAAYFGRFLEPPPQVKNTPPDNLLYPRSKAQLANHRIFVEQLYNRLAKLSSEDLRYIWSMLPGLREAYGLKESWLDEFYDDVLGLLLQLRTVNESEPTAES